VARANSKDVKIEEVKYDGNIKYGDKILKHRPIIVGMGPAGLFAGLILAKNGYKPLIIEQGEPVEDREKTVNYFWKTGKLNLKSNVQFGEGGAGTFSDGKLTTRIKDSRCNYILDELVKFGAPAEIIYSGKPHIGTDLLKGIVKNIREEIKALGGEVLFNTKLVDIKTNNGKIKSVITEDDEIPCNNLVLAIGHSSRDTYEMLFKNQFYMETKPFAIGVRAEHPQSLIDINQYGKYSNHKRLKSSDYKLTYRSSLNRSVYSFCMCPGGKVVNASSEENRLVVNGMSNYKRNLENANSAIVVSVGKEDFVGKSPLAGMEFQRHYESLAYKEGGSNYSVPIQLLGDFIKGQPTNELGKINPSITSSYKLANLNNCLPSYVTDSLKEAFKAFNNKIKGFSREDVVLTGIETRTSAPLRISRNENMESISVKGVYPTGEGAGYAGGIVSAAVDGMKCAENIMQEYIPLI
ncbi:MAG: NAD(P)/FAD-dependent oxidoreductase, partial [Clostridiaceae bacterium]